MRQIGYLRSGIWIVCIVIFLLMTSLFSSAKGDISTINEPVTIPNTEIKLLHSQVADRDYRLFIALPPDYKKSDKHYSVLYLIDPQITFGTVTDYVRLMSATFVQELPELIIIGIGYTTDSIPDIVTLRTRDLTPSVVGNADETGWADRFLSFIIEELIPFVEANYRIDTSDRTLAGHSLGGLFTLYALLSKPDVFNHYIASSPSLWWDSRYLLRYEENSVWHSSNMNANLFISAGEMETDPPFSIATDVPAFVEMIEKRTYDGFEVSMHIFEDQTHASVVTAAITEGIKVVYNSVEN